MFRANQISVSGRSPFESPAGEGNPIISCKTPPGGYLASPQARGIGAPARATGCLLTAPGGKTVIPGLKRLEQRQLYVSQMEKYQRHAFHHDFPESAQADPDTDEVFSR